MSLKKDLQLLFSWAPSHIKEEARRHIGGFIVLHRGFWIVVYMMRERSRDIDDDIPRAPYKNHGRYKLLTETKTHPWTYELYTPTGFGIADAYDGAFQTWKEAINAGKIEIDAYIQEYM